MLHLDYIQKNTPGIENSFIKNASGRYYTSKLVGKRLARVVAKIFKLATPTEKSLRVVDPFGGDGRLLDWLISSWEEMGNPPLQWDVEIWDMYDIGFKFAQDRFARLSEEGIRISTTFKIVDSFREACDNKRKFDIVLTNPPWELLKPDKREMNRLRRDLHENYISKMREYDNWITDNYPLSQPKHKFAGWGTNLSRVGLDVSLRLVRKGGLIGAVLPASILADTQSVNLRKHLLLEHSVLDVAYYPAEAKQYDSADVPSVTVVVKFSEAPSSFVPLLTHSVGSDDEQTIIDLNKQTLEKVDYVLPVSFGAKAMDLLIDLASRFPRWHDLEIDTNACLWAGREVDETGSSMWLKALDRTSPPFIKGRMIKRFVIREEPNQSVARSGWTSPPSITHARIAWRDVSRPSQKRRMIATIIPSGWAAGNSLGVAYFLDDNDIALNVLLGVMNSTTFEFQLRAYLATSHVSLSSLRKVAVPPINLILHDEKLARLVSTILEGDTSTETVADAYVAKQLYHLNESEYATVLELFHKITTKERAEYLEAFRFLNAKIP